MDTSNPTDSAPQSAGATPSHDGGAFWRARTLIDLAAEQGVALVPDFDALVGQGKELWADDEEFDAFLINLRVSRPVPLSE